MFKKDNVREVPKKNYIIITIIFIVSIALILALRSWYLSYKEYEKTVPILQGVITEIKSHEIDSYINDNQSVIIYLGASDDSDCRKIEPKLKELINKHHLKEKIVYYNIVDDKENAVKELNEKYADGVNVNNYPAIILFENGRIIDFKSKNKNSNLLISDIEEILNEYEILGD